MIEWSGKNNILLLVYLEIIATSYQSMIFKTDVFNLCTQECIYVSIYICYIWIACRWWLRAIQGVPEDDNQVNSEIHLEAIIV